MKANEVRLTDFLSQNKTQFVIPVYQRNYDWKEGQCMQLFKDIEELGVKDGGTHFVGSIVFIHDGVYTSSEVKQLVVIDGQQRLTTISLLYLALYHFSKEHGHLEKAAEINETFLTNKFVEQDDSKLKLKQTADSAKAFNYLLLGNPPHEFPDYNRVIENYGFFRQKIDSGNLTSILDGLKRLVFIEISLERDKDDPQRIFESLNSTGLDLSQADLIRNYILMGLKPSAQQEIFAKYWEPIEQNAKDELKQQSLVSEFIRDFLTLKNKKIPTKRYVYQEFKDRFDTKSEGFYTSTLDELKAFSIHYKKLINPKSENDVDISRELTYIRNVEINVTYPFLLLVYEDFTSGHITKPEFIEVLRTVQSFVWRRFMVNLPTNALNKIFMTLYADVVKSDYTTSVQRALLNKRGYQRWPNDEEVIQALKEKDMYNIQPKNRLYFLEILENHKNREYVHTRIPDITIEHIFPQRPDVAWKSDLSTEDYELFKSKYLNTAANLTLSGNNGALGNKSFMEKKQMNKDGGEQGYSFSSLWLNRYLREIDQWTAAEWNHRYQQLRDRFLSIWTYPSTMEVLMDEDSEFNVYNAPSPKGRKLTYYIFQDRLEQATDIAKMYFDVLETLFKANPEFFFRTTLREELALTSNESSLRAPRNIGENYFVESNMDSSTKLRKLRTVLGVFDMEDELTFKFEG